MIDLVPIITNVIVITCKYNLTSNIRYKANARAENYFEQSDSNNTFTSTLLYYQ